MRPRKKEWNLAAIEVKLRQLQFRQYNEFVPTAHQMTLNEHAFYEAMRGDELEHYPGEYAEIAYSIKELCTELEKFVASKSLAGAACGDWPALLVVVVARASVGVGVGVGMGVGAHPHEGVGAVAGVSPHSDMTVAVTRR